MVLRILVVVNRMMSQRMRERRERDMMFMFEIHRERGSIHECVKWRVRDINVLRGHSKMLVVRRL